MKRLALIAFLLLVPLPPAASADACSPLSCAPSQFALDGGHLLATRPSTSGPLRVIDLRTGATVRTLPAGIVEAHTLVHQDGTRLTWYDLASGRVLQRLDVPAAAALTLVGASQDGRRAVLASNDLRGRFLVVSRAGSQRVVLADGRYWAFDALAGSRLYLIRNLSQGYQVRLYDLAAGRLLARPLKDPDGSSTIWGIAFARLASPDGRYLFTLYLSPDGGAMIHQLDLLTATARCVGLAGDGNFNAAMTYSLALSRDGRTLWATSPGYGRAVAIDVRTHRVRELLRFAPYLGGLVGMATTAPDGRIAVSDGAAVWFVEPGRRRVVQVGVRTVHALAFAPDGRRLWALGRAGNVWSLAV